jgi:hypothetical protein
MAQHYSNPKRASEPHALPDVETFMGWSADCPSCDGTLYDFSEAGETDVICSECGYVDNAEPPLQYVLGWYWQACFPGCLPDGEPNGPFDTEQEAIADAQSGAEQDGES